MSRNFHIWTPEEDAFIRAQYDVSIPERSKEIASALGVPQWKVNRRAGQMGLSRPKERPWTADEVQYLENHYHRTAIRTVAKHLGRSVTAVRLKAKRLGYRKYAEGYTVSSLAAALGVEAHWVQSRIKDGQIAAARRHTERTARQGGDALLITEGAVLAFIRDHTYEIDLRKVDHLWFLDTIREGLAQTSRNGRLRNGSH